MVDKSKVATSSDLAGGKPKGKGKGKKAESEVPTPVVIQDPGLAEAVEAAKASGKTSLQTFEPKQSDTPINIYKERTEDGEFIWWTTEDGREVGRKAIEAINDQTQIKTLQGYEFDIPFDAKVAEKLKEAARAKTKFYRKDGTSRSAIPFEDFVK